MVLRRLYKLAYAARGKAETHPVVLAERYVNAQEPKKVKAPQGMLDLYSSWAA